MVIVIVLLEIIYSRWNDEVSPALKNGENTTVDSGGRFRQGKRSTDTQNVHLNMTILINSKKKPKKKLQY